MGPCSESDQCKGQTLVHQFPPIKTLVDTVITEGQMQLFWCLMNFTPEVDTSMTFTSLFVPDADAGRDWGQEEKGTTEDEMAGWHHRLDEHEFG